MAIYTPRQTRGWSTRELDALTGKYVTVEIDRCRFAGVVAYASVGRGDTVFIEWASGGRVTWAREGSDATITVEG